MQNLIAMCGIAFLVVFVLLALMAIAMRLITFVFPERRAGLDSATAAAIAATVTSVFPGTRVSRIEEKTP